MDEGSVIVDVGGGVVNNMAGFLAATLYRGVELIHIPTTTMAQVDAAIDFKQAVNSKKGKNLTGAYHPASHVLIDPDTLATLPERHIRNGLAESLKHAITQDAEFFQWLLKNERPLTDLDFWETVIRRTIALKVPLLNGDPHDEANEMLPQYGHSIGHAVEHVSGYAFLHGEAVAIGMCVSAEIARLIGVCDEATVEAHYQLCSRYGLPTQIPQSINVEDVLNTIRYDKHYLGSLPRMALVSSVGTVWKDQGVVSIPIDYPILARAIEANQSHRMK
jgi:3-dehydroquinate synthase